MKRFILLFTISASLSSVSAQNWGNDPNDYDRSSGWNQNQQQGWNNGWDNPYQDPNYYPHNADYRGCPPPPRRSNVVVVSPPPTYCAPVVIAPRPAFYYNPYGYRPYRQHRLGYYGPRRWGRR